MKLLLCVTSLLPISLAARFAEAHGTPINVGQTAGELAVSGGLPDSAGFAPQIFVEDDEDGDPFATLTLPNVGPAVIWQVPGYLISGLTDESSLSIDVIARPVRDSAPPEERTMWYWSPQTASVEPAASDFYLLGTGMRYTTLSPDDTAAPPPFLLAATLAGQQGFHNHTLLSYALDNDPPPAAGAYGFFARLTSSLYAPSNPILIVINHGVDYEQMVAAALAINAAAAGLEGDFDQDGDVDAADYVVWLKTIGTMDAYEAWRANFGRGGGAAGGEARVHAVVAEPASIALAACLAMICGNRRSRRESLQWRSSHAL